MTLTIRSTLIAGYASIVLMIVALGLGSFGLDNHIAATCLAVILVVIVGSVTARSISITTLRDAASRLAAGDASKAEVEAKWSAEGAHAAKGQLLARMNREIRMPLNGVIGMCELLAKTPLKPLQREYLEVIQTSADALLAVVRGESTEEIAPRVASIPEQSGVERARVVPASSPRSLRVLVVEDNIISQKVALALLTSQGHTVMLAGDGRQGVAAFARERFDAILMDVQMPEMGGMEATKAIREIEWERGGGERTPIVALTAGGMEDDRAACLAAGMDNYLSKPIHPQSLNDMLNLVAMTTRVGEAA